MRRKIVSIDEDLCDGCGLCVPACREGAIKIENGKARLVSDRLCDGLGDCLGHCPKGAITISIREAEGFDDTAVAVTRAAVEEKVSRKPAPLQGGCPGSRVMQFEQTSDRVPHDSEDAESSRSELKHWPVQLNLLPPQAPILKGASLLIAADCVPVAYADFHRELLRGRAVLIGCPKFDDLAGYLEKLTAILQHNQIQELTIARMEVPCCQGITAAIVEARRRANANIKTTEVIVGTRGNIVLERDIPFEPNT